MHKPFLHPNPSFIQEWEKAGASLTSAISHFLDLSTRLESQCTVTETTPNDLIARIDSSLSLLQITLDGQLTQARLALAKTRNRLTRASSILRLPEEVLTDIFLHFVYDPYEENSFSTTRAMNLDVQLIYERVHTLLGVCTTWRNNAVACGPLWFLVPIVDPIVGWPRALSTELSLERAGNRPLHLAIFKPQYWYPRLQAITPRLSQIQAINIWSDSASGIELHEVIRMLLKNNARSLAKLSLKHLALNPLPADSPFNPFTRLEPQLLVLVKSLSALRISNITVAWEGISFSRTLTEFWISDVTLDEVAVLGFFSALESAPELQHLTIVFARAVLDDDTEFIPRTITLPKLKTLHLESLPFNFLDLLLTTIAPGPYQLTLNPCDDVYADYPSEEMAEEDEICDLFKRRPVHKMILAVEEQGFWELESGLHTVLESVPELKILILNFYEIDVSILKALVQSQGRTVPFPKFEVLEIHAASFRVPLDDLRGSFSEILEHHPIQRMVIGGMVQLTTNIEDAKPLDENDSTIQWLKTRISKFYVSADAEDAPALVEKWQLWDI